VAAEYTSNRFTIMSISRLSDMACWPKIRENIVKISKLRETPLLRANLKTGVSPMLKYPSKLEIVLTNTRKAPNPLMQLIARAKVQVIVDMAVIYIILFCSYAPSFQSDVILFAKSGFYCQSWGIIYSDGENWPLLT